MEMETQAVNLEPLPFIKPDVRERGEAILKKLDHINSPSVAEVGVFAGSLSHFLCTCRPDMAFYMVDNWLAGEDQPDHYKATNDYSTRIDKTEAERLKGLAITVARHHVGAIIKEGDSWDVGMKMAPNSLDLVFLDADHSYEGVKKDLQAWRATVKSGGWISGHDYGNVSERFDFSGNIKAVNEFAAEMGRELERGPNFTWFLKMP